MQIPELLTRIGADVSYQYLDQCLMKADYDHKKGTKITFGTDVKLEPFKGTVEMGIVVWLPRDKAATVLAQPDEMPATPQLVSVSSIDVEKMLAECVPGGSSCDPQQVADAIRRYCNAWPPSDGQEPEWQNDVQAAFGGIVQTPQG